MAVFEPTIRRAIELLKSVPNGADTAAVRIALGVTYAHASGALCEAVKDDRIKWVHAPKGKAHNRRVYFHPDLAPAATGEESMKSIRHPRSHQKLKSLGRPKHVSPPTGDAIVPAGLVPIKGPSFTDSRFKPDRVEPFFSAMTPGSYISTGSAIERAYAQSSQD